MCLQIPGHPCGSSEPESRLCVSIVCRGDCPSHRNKEYSERHRILRASALLFHWCSNTKILSFSDDVRSPYPLMFNLFLCIPDPVLAEFSLRGEVAATGHRTTTTQPTTHDQTADTTETRDQNEDDTKDDDDDTLLILSQLIGS